MLQNDFIAAAVCARSYSIEWILFHLNYILYVMYHFWHHFLCLIMWLLYV